jgi:hypothetical protein
MKTCKLCKQLKDNCEFSPHSKFADGLQSRCKACRNRKQKEAYEANPNRYKESAKLFYVNNKQRIDARIKLYIKTNKEKVKERKRIRKSERYKSDSIYRLKIVVSNRIRKSIQRRNQIKKTKATTILGCSIEQLYEHLKASAIKRYGKFFPQRRYDIDHILPISLAKTEEELIKMNHYTNLQYLLPRDNLKKSNKLEVLDGPIGYR